MVLVFTMAIHLVIAQVVSLRRVAITQHWSMMSALFFIRFCEHATKSSGICKYERVVGHMKNQFLESFSEKMFQQRTRLNFDTFCALIRVVGSNVE